MTDQNVHTKATISSGYHWRVGLFAIICLVWSVLCFKDGLYTYPEQRRHAQAFQEARDQGILDSDLWRDQAQENGWDPDEDPGVAKSDFDFYAQFVMAAITTPLALIWGVGFILGTGRWIGLGPDGLITSWGQHVRFDVVTKLDKHRWQSKGIAVVHYKAGSQQLRLVLDDWKYRREPITIMVRTVEDHLSDDQIVGGTRETTKEQEPTDQDPSDSEPGHQTQVDTQAPDQPA